MATYSGIKGQSVQVVSSDPSPLIPGQIWYNSTSNTLKAAVQQAGPAAWTAGTDMPATRRDLAGAGESNTAALAFGGSPSGATTFSYNGSTWTSGGSMSAARSKLTGTGTNTAALAFGGSSNSDCTESYNGTSWTTGGALGTARYGLGGAGTNTAALAFGGKTTGPGADATVCTESYNGTSWTSGGAMGYARYNVTGVGVSNTAALVFGGFRSLACPSPNGRLALTESYNGSVWTAGGSISEGKQNMGGAGTNTAALAFGGVRFEDLSTTEIYNGSTWTIGSAMGSARYSLGSAGRTNTSALAFGGVKNYSRVSCTESYGAGLTTCTKTLTIS